MHVCLFNEGRSVRKSVVFVRSVWITCRLELKGPWISFQSSSQVSCVQSPLKPSCSLFHSSHVSSVIASTLFSAVIYGLFLLLHFPTGINAAHRVNTMNRSFDRTLIRSLTVAPAAGVMDMQKLLSVFQWTHFVIALTHLWKTGLRAFTAGAEWTVCLLTVYLVYSFWLWTVSAAGPWRQAGPCHINEMKQITQWLLWKEMSFVSQKK